MYFHRTFISANRPAETATDTQQRLQASVALYIVLHKQVLPVEYGVSELRNPVAQNQDTARTGQHQVQLDVAMAENEIVDFGMGFQVFLGKTDKILLVLAQIRRVAAFHTMLQAAVRRPRQTEIHSPTGMDAGKHALAKAVAEHGTQVITNLARMSVALQALGHPGLHLTAFDPDTVTEANIGRQLFSETELGLNKATALVTRVNRFFGYAWEARECRYPIITKEGDKSVPLANIIITCTDNTRSRHG